MPVVTCVTSTKEICDPHKESMFRNVCEKYDECGENNPEEHLIPHPVLFVAQYIG